MLCCIINSYEQMKSKRRDKMELITKIFGYLSITSFLSIPVVSTISVCFSSLLTLREIAIIGILLSLLLTTNFVKFIKKT